MKLLVLERGLITCDNLQVIHYQTHNLNYQTYNNHVTKGLLKIDKNKIQVTNIFFLKVTKQLELVPQILYGFLNMSPMVVVPKLACHPAHMIG